MLMELLLSAFVEVVLRGGGDGEHIERLVWADLEFCVLARGKNCLRNCMSESLEH